MSASGSKLIRVAVGRDDPTEYRRDEVYLVDDACPWVDLGFALDAKTSFLADAVPAGGTVIRCSERSGDDVRWFRWQLWKQPAFQRRRAFFILDSLKLRIRLKVWVKFSRIFSDAQYGSMISDIRAAFRHAVWTDSARGSLVERDVSDPYRESDSAEHFIQCVEREIRVARRLLASPHNELAPSRPGEAGPSASLGLTISKDLPENHLVDLWCAKRTRDLTRSLDHLGAEHATIVEALIERGSDPKDARRAHLRTDQESLELLKMRALRLRRDVMILQPSRAPRALSITPRMLRNPDLRLLLGALGSHPERPAVLHTATYSTFAERTVPEQFELWGAIALGKALQALGWESRGGPSLRTGTGKTLRPLERVTWMFAHGEETLRLIYEPHALQPTIGSNLPDGPRLSRLQRAASTFGAARREVLFSSGSYPSPDYVLFFRNKGGGAASVGDASFSDLEHIRQNPGDDSVPDKVRKISLKYAAHLGFLSDGDSFAISRVASFVVLPGPAEAWSQFGATQDALDEHDIALLGAEPPCDASNSSWPTYLRTIASIVETLRAHAADRSTWIPRHPGTER